MIRTDHVQVVRGSTFSRTRICRDDNNRPVDLTNAIVYMAIRADVKIGASVKLTSDDPAPTGWRAGVVISNQDETPGEYTWEVIPADTSALTALGHDDPWLYDIKIQLEDGSVIVDVSQSNFDLYPQMTDLPA